MFKVITPGGVTSTQAFTVSAGTGSIIGSGACTTDWVIIPCATENSNDGTTNCNDRFCGTLLNVANVGSDTAGNAPVYCKYIRND